MGMEPTWDAAQRPPLDLNTFQAFFNPFELTLLLSISSVWGVITYIILEFSGCQKVRISIPYLQSTELFSKWGKW
jgi:hypothetical protein